MSAALTIEDAVFRYPGASAPALAGVSLEVEAGDVCALLGPNGAGKTTLLNLVCGLARPGGGRVSILGRDPGDRAARRHLGVCPQELALFPSLTGEENLRLFGTLAGLRGAGLASRIDVATGVTALGDALDRRVETYSGGMKRRLNFAVALLHEPEVLLLDEPTEGVDPHSRILLYDALESLAREGRTLVLTTHRLEEAERLGRSIVVLDHGRVVASGPRADLLGGPDGARSLEARFFELTGRELRD